MNKVVLFLILIVLNVIGTTVAQAEVHVHEKVQTEMSSGLESLHQADTHQNDHKDDCNTSHCCRHCHTLVVLLSSADLTVSTNSFLLNFRDLDLQITEKFYEIIKPPLV